MARIGSYEILEEIGRGGAGVVYRAFDPGLSRRVAVKVLAVAEESPTLRERFAREARALARLRHPGIVPVYAVGETPGETPDSPARPYLVMELVEGESLQAVIERDGPLPARRAAEIARALAAALVSAHAQGIIHRDVKPDNVLLSRAGETMLTDFGLAKDLAATSDGTGSISIRGRCVGTPGYWSPEQAAGAHERVGAATDIYGLGATLFAALTGHPPFDGESLVELAHKAISAAPPSPSSDTPEVDASLDAIVLCCLQKDPAARFADAAALERALGAWLAGQPLEPLPAPRPAHAERPGRSGRRSRPRSGWKPTAAAALIAAVPAAALGALAVSLGGGETAADAELRTRIEAAEREATAARARAFELQRELASLRASVKRALVPDDAWWTPSPEQVAYAEKIGQPIYRTNALGMRFVLVPPGTFTMGSPEGEAGRMEHETPHEVTLTEGYYIGATEVTNAQYGRLQLEHDSGEHGGESLDDDDQPVVVVSWIEAVAFCAWLSARENDPGRYRLPTEAEWERAARAGTTTARYWGDGATGFERHENIADAAAGRGWGANRPGGASPEQEPRFHDGDDGHALTAPVGSFAPNRFGLFDPLGNAAEWCADFFGPHPAEPQTDPRGPETGALRVIRGSSWDVEPSYCRSAARGRLPPSASAPYVGFRIVRVIHAESRRSR